MYAEEHEIFRQAARKFLGREITPNVEEWDETRKVPSDILNKFVEHGFLCP